MNTEQLASRTTVQWCGHGSYRVTIIYQGRQYHCRSNNSLAYDRLSSDVSPLTVECDYTLRQALNAFYQECKRKNNLL